MLTAAGIIPDHVIVVQRGRGIDKEPVGSINAEIQDSLKLNLFPFLEATQSILRQEINGISQIMDAEGVDFHSIPAKSTVEVLTDCIRQLVNPFVDLAHPLPSPKSLTSADAASQQLPWGVSKDFCPVVLHDQNMLVKGVAKFSATYLVSQHS